MTENVADDMTNRPLEDYTAPRINYLSRSIRCPSIKANNFGIKPTTIQLFHNFVQFAGFADEDSNDHILNFE